MEGITVLESKGYLNFKETIDLLHDAVEEIGYSCDLTSSYSIIREAYEILREKFPLGEVGKEDDELRVTWHNTKKQKISLACTETIKAWKLYILVDNKIDTLTNSGKDLAEYIS